MWQLLLIPAPTVPPDGVLIGLVILPLIVLTVVTLSAFLSGESGPRAIIPDHDNRWPGYPLIPGDIGYSPTQMGSFGNLGPMRLSKKLGGGPMWNPDIPVQAHYA
jgi:hypothetical protein